MFCNCCHSQAIYRLKLTFTQAKGFPRFAISFEAEGGYCYNCKGRIDRSIALKDFREIVDPNMRQEVSTVFKLRGWGEIDWNDTTADFILINSVPDKRQLKLRI